MNLKSKPLVVLLSMLVCVTWVSSATAQSGSPAAVDVAVTTAFTHQGQIEFEGALVTGTCDMTFLLFDSAAGGLQQGPLLDAPDVPVADGVFAVELNFGNQFTGQARWLETATRCGADAGYTTLPRVALTATPYAIGLMPGAIITGNIPYGFGNATLRADNASSSGGTALFGFATANTGSTAGVYGLSNSATGAGVWGQNDGGTGVLGESLSSAGVKGTSATNVGVVGTSDSWVGVHGFSNSAFGVYGKSFTGAGVVGESTDWIGVFGTSINQSGGTFTSTTLTGVWAESHSATWPGLYARNTATGLAAWLDGRTRTDILEVTGGADLAERFDTGESHAGPGTLMVIDAAHPGQLTISTQAYDTKVAGIVSGAGGVSPGLTLQQDGVLDGDTHVAIAGRVYVYATAINGAIEPGDLLTTSDEPGHAMRATDRERSPGAIIGKAMTGLDSGTGLVLVLVNLQ